MMAMQRGRLGWALFGVGVCVSAAVGCASETGSDSEPEVTRQALENRAYVVSRESDELTVIDLDSMEVIGRVATGGASSHMAEVSADFSKVYVTTSQDEVAVVDAARLEVVKRIPVGVHGTHLSASRDGKLLAVMAEDEGTGAVSFIDTERDVEIKRLGGFFTPHFMRFARDGRYGYVANANGDHLSRVDLETLEIDGHIYLDGFEAPPGALPRTGEGGFADAQIDADGILYAAHNATGRVLVYDTEKQRKLPEIQVGKQPWIVYAEHPFPELTARVVPNFGDSSVSVISGSTPKLTGVVNAADKESFGVNYSPLVPDRAFVMNRFREEIAVVDTSSMQAMSKIDVGGTTETAATTPDGKLIIASVSSVDKIVFIDPVSSTIVKTLENVGRYPWSVTVPSGQNYCH
jgi:DNA-binding beta-propeller fold protein YncE